MGTKAHIFSFFAGAGFLDLGFEKAGFTSAFVNEFHKPFMNAYVYAREKIGVPQPLYGYHEGDIRDLLAVKHQSFLQERVANSRKRGRLVGFIGGPPCPDFSVGGKNLGQEGDRGKLSAAYIELICQQEPDFFLFENVKGLLRTKKHRAFYETLKRRLIDSGYILTDKLTNSLSYGVPQDRDRIILLGFKENLISKKRNTVNEDTLHLRAGVFPWDSNYLFDLPEVLSLQWPAVSPYEEDSVLPKPVDLPEGLTIEHWFQRNSVESHPNSGHHFQPQSGLKKISTVSEGDVSKKSYKRPHRWRYSPTAAYGNNEVHLHPYKSRRISAAEALAIQSLPRDFEFPDNMTLSNMFKATGNGVPFLMSLGIAKTVNHFLEA